MTKLDVALILQERLQVNRQQLGLGTALARPELDRVAKELKRRLQRASSVDTVVDVYSLALLGLTGLLGAEKSLRGAYLATLNEFAEVALTRLAQRSSGATSQKLRLSFAEWQVEDCYRRGQFEVAVLASATTWRNVQDEDVSVARFTFGLTHAKALFRCGFVERGTAVLAALRRAAPPHTLVTAALLEAQSLRSRGLFQDAVEVVRSSPLEKLDPAHELRLEAGFSSALSGSLALKDYRPLVTFCRQHAQCPPDLLCLARVKLHADPEKGALTMLPKGTTLSRKVLGPARSANRIGRMAVAIDRLYDKRVALEERLKAARHALVASARLPSADEECLTKAAVYRWLLRSKAQPLADAAKDMIAAAGLRYSAGVTRDPYGVL